MPFCVPSIRPSNNNQGNHMKVMWLSGATLALEKLLSFQINDLCLFPCKNTF